MSQPNSCDTKSEKVSRRRLFSVNMGEKIVCENEVVEMKSRIVEVVISFKYLCCGFSEDKGLPNVQAKYDQE